ncbi:hypothetical protein [Thermococcus sp. 2319x1]|uniref:hypothetical protein n=1 Tax=Thermococcus sp. 2319x1 TaxID=1674923 RepID=UPI0015837B0C|nr:hypothetical protein [Thermococcus sp. 2319x1]
MKLCESCNASASYRVYQYGEVVKEGTAKIKWLKGTLCITVPLEQSKLTETS